MDFSLRATPGMSAIGDGRDLAWGVVDRFCSDAITLTDEFIACRVKAAGKPTGVRVEVAGVFRDELADRMEREASL